MRNKTRRKANELRRLRAALSQKPLHMRGMQPHPLTGKDTPGQLDRAEMNLRDKTSRYPSAPRYKDVT